MSQNPSSSTPSSKVAPPEPDPPARHDDGLPDAELLAAYERGDDEAATALFRRYYNRLIRLVGARRGWKLTRVESSDDVVQSVFRSVFSRGQKGEVELTGDQELWPLLATVALNKIYNRAEHWGRQRRDPDRLADESVGQALQPDGSPDNAALVSELIDQLLAAFPAARQEIVSSLIQGQAVTEIARRAGVSERTVYSTRAAVSDQLHRALSVGE